MFARDSQRRKTGVAGVARGPRATVASTLPERILAMQRTAGNQATSRWLQRGIPIQRQIQVHPNPHLTSRDIVAPNDGSTAVENAARMIDYEVEHAASEVEGWLEQLSEGNVNFDEMRYHFNLFSDSYADNFVNKAIDFYGGKKGNAGLLRAAAGYVIEDYANVVATQLGLEMQFHLEGSRPDYMMETGETYAPFGPTGHLFNANGLIDVTSASEAASGHIPEKVMRAKPETAMDYPHLCDVYYQDLDVGDGKDKKQIDMSGEAVTARNLYFQEQVKAAELRRKSLRSFKK